ncbi:MAG: PilZ domain-containing protein [Myxococcota bacterium]
MNAERIQARLEVASPADLADLYYPNGRLGGLTVPGKPPGALGQRLELTVDIARPRRHFVVRGQLAWVRHKSGPNQPAGFGFDFDPDDDAARVRLLAFARNELSSAATRVDPRQQVELPVRLVHEGTQRREMVADLSPGGAFVRTWNPLPVGARVQLFLRPPMALTSLSFRGQVAWVRLAGEHPGMGLVFERDAAMQPRLEKLLNKLAR